jgi:hypothetical protein
MDRPLTGLEIVSLKKLLETDDLSLIELVQKVRTLAPAVAVSISNSGDLARFGLSEAHERSLSDRIHLHLLAAGCQIVYGGSLEASVDGAPNFTDRLFELVRDNARLAESRGARLAPILNYAPWPLRLGYDAGTLHRFGQDAQLKEGPRPPSSEVPESDDELFPAPVSGKRLFPSDTPARRLAWARGLTAMRAASTMAVAARIVIGGRVDAFAGLCPGIVEEAWLSLIHRQPLFLVGGLGGAAQAVIGAMRGRDAVILKSAVTLPQQYDKCLQLAAARGFEILNGSAAAAPDVSHLAKRLVLLDRMATDFKKAGDSGFARAIENGLDDAENEILFQATEPVVIATLVLQGLSRKLAK